MTTPPPPDGIGVRSDIQIAQLEDQLRAAYATVGDLSVQLAKMQAGVLTMHAELADEREAHRLLRLETIGDGRDVDRRDPDSSGG